MLNRVAFALAASVVAVKPLYVHDPRWLAPSLVLMLAAGSAFILWLTGQVLARGDTGGSSLRGRLPRKAASPAPVREPLRGVLAHGHTGGSSLRGRLPRKAASPAPVREPLPGVLARRVRVVRPGIALPLGLLAIAVVIGIFTADYRRPALAAGLEWLSTLLAVFCLVQTVRDRAAVETLLAMLLATGAVVALYAVHQYFIGLDQLREAYRLNPQQMLWRDVGIEYGGWMQKRFEKRLADQAAFSTFALSNSLAAYCLMLLPVGLALLVGAVRRRRAWWGLAALAVTVPALALALGLTKSKGGYAAGAVVLGAFGVGAAWPRLRRYARVLVPAAAVAVVLAAAGLAWRVNAVGVEAALGPSMRFRVDYWTGALRVIERHPLRGVGLGGFRDHYTLHKNPESPEDVRHPHNLVLGLWTAMGPLGVAAFGWLFAASLWSGRRGGVSASVGASAASLSRSPVGRARRTPISPPRGGPPADPGPSPWRLVPAAVALPLWLVVYVLNLQAGAFCLAGGVVWLAVSMAVAWPGRVERATTGRAASHRLVRVGLTAGVLGFLVHSLIDLDVGVPALVVTVLALLAAYALARPAVPRETRPVPGWVGVGLLAVTGLAALWFAYGVAKPLFTGEGDYAAARRAQTEAVEAVRGGDYARADGKVRSADALYRRSLERDPLNADAAFALARLAFDKWRALLRAPVTDREREAQFRTGLEHLRLAQRLHPRRGQFRSLEAEMHVMAAENAVSADERLRCLSSARQAADRLVDGIYPTHVRYRLLRARILEALGERDGARRDYQAALDYDDLQRDPLLRLPADERRSAADALRRLVD